MTALPSAPPAKVLLNPLEQDQQLLWIKPCFDHRRAIRIAAVGRAQRRRLQRGRNRFNGYAFLRQSHQCRRQHTLGRTVAGMALVGAQRDQVALPQASDVLRDPGVKLRTAIAEEAHPGAVPCRS